MAATLLRRRFRRPGKLSDHFLYYASIAIIARTNSTYNDLQMTKREAALILGIRESAPKKKVREAHRRLSVINHPDTGGSTFLASKINEAKEKLLGAQ